MDVPSNSKRPEIIIHRWNRQKKEAKEKSGGSHSSICSNMLGVEGGGLLLISPEISIKIL